MPALTYSLPVTGTAPNETVTKAAHEAAIQAPLDDLADRIDALSSGVYIVGEWDAADGAFPTERPDASAVQTGDAWYVSGAGTVDGVAFAQGDRLVALRDGGGATYSTNWLRAAYDDYLTEMVDKLTSAEAAQAAAEAAALTLGATAYATRAAMPSAGTAGRKAYVYDDGTMANNGLWFDTGSAWVKDRLDVKTALDLKADAAALAAMMDTLPGSDGLVFADTNGFAVVKITPEGAALFSDPQFPNGLTTGDLTADGEGDNAFEIVDELGFIGYKIGLDGTLNDGETTATATAATVMPDQSLTDWAALVTRAMVMFYGQSNSVGWTATPPLSTSQPYENQMVVSGALTALVATTEEKPWFGACNWATASLLRDVGLAPSAAKLVGAGAGVGGASITALLSGSSGYTGLVGQVTTARGLDASLIVPAICWIHGETDTENGMTEATYLGHLATLQSSLQTSIRGIVGGTKPLPFLISQISWKITLNDDVALAQLHACQDGTERYFLAFPTYRIPYRTSDGNVHFSHIGVKMAGAYMGRAMARLLRGLRPQWLNPVSASRSGRVVRIRFDVPYGPLVLDRTDLGPTIDNGFRIVDGSGTAAIASQEIDGNEVVITCGRDFSGTVTARYGLDYLGSGLNITSGASGNLRDSHPDAVVIDGTEYQLFNAAPAFSLTAYTLEA